VPTGSLPAGTRLGHYEILEPLGKGGMGEVYRARDDKLGRVVALKVLTGNPDAEARTRFEQEARAAAALSHPNIIAIHDVGLEGPVCYSVTELLDGEDLRQRLASAGRHTPIPASNAVRIALQIARGLSAAHEKGIVHRDIKPANIFLTKDGSAKILDFGIARLMPTQTIHEGATASISSPLTSGDTLLGTVPYMSPEQVRGLAVDHRSDIFSFGVVGYEMLTGRCPFARETVADTMSAILREDPPDPALLGIRVPQAFLRILGHCLEKRPEERFQSARDLAFALESLSTGTHEAPSGSAQARSARGASKRRWIALAGALLLLAAGFVAGTLVHRPTGPKIDPSPPRAFTQRTFLPLTIWNARFAPDGRTILFSGSMQGTTPEIYTATQEYPEPRPVGLTDTHLLAVSSKGEMAILTNAEHRFARLFEGTLATVPIGGLAPRPVLAGVREADWSPDGSQLAVIRSVNALDQLEYPIGTVLCRHAGCLSDPRVSPDGGRVACFEHPIVGDDAGSLIVVDRSGKRTVLAAGFMGLQGIVWSRDGGKIFFSGSQASPNLAVWEVDAGGGASGPVVSTPNRMTIFDVAPDGRRLVTSGSSRMEVVACRPGNHEEREISWLDRTLPCRLSASGERFLFCEQSAACGSRYASCIRGTDGSPVVQLGEGTPQDFSPDMTRIVARLPSNPPKLVIYPLGPGFPETLNTGNISPQAALWSHDGSRLFIEGREPGASGRAYALTLPAGPIVPISPEHRSLHGISKSGSVLLRGTNGIDTLLCVGDAAGMPVHGLRSNEEIALWCKDERFVLAYDPTRIPISIDRIDLTTGARTRFALFTPDNPSGTTGVDAVVVSEDESTYVVGFPRGATYLYTFEGR
jgi:eukaryotic-like serine/threonine-protein kinase